MCLLAGTIIWYVSPPLQSKSIQQFTFMPIAHSCFQIELESQVSPAKSCPGVLRPFLKVAPPIQP